MQSNWDRVRKNQRLVNISSIIYVRSSNIISMAYNCFLLFKIFSRIYAYNYINSRFLNHHNQSWQRGIRAHKIYTIEDILD